MSTFFSKQQLPQDKRLRSGCTCSFLFSPCFSSLACLWVCQMQEMVADCSKPCFFLFGLSSLASGFPGSSAGKESTCIVGNPGLIPGSGRSPGEGISYPLEYSWASLVAQLVKNPPAMGETWVWSLGWEDPLDEGKRLPAPVFWPGELYHLCLSEGAHTRWAKETEGNHQLKPLNYDSLNIFL